MKLLGDIHSSQTARLIDLTTITPFLLYVSQKKQITDLDRKILLGIGLFAVVYNLSNLIENWDKE